MTLDIRPGMGPNCLQMWKQMILTGKELKPVLNPLSTGNPLTGTLANSEDPDEMLQKCSISSGSSLFAYDKNNLQRLKYNIFRKV